MGSFLSFPSNAQKHLDIISLKRVDGLPDDIQKYDNENNHETHDAET
jgi:hypothetical protein